MADYSYSGVLSGFVPKVVPGVESAKAMLALDVQRIQGNYWRAKAFHSANWDNCVENWRFYWGKFAERGQGQWPARVVSTMGQQGRQLLTYNMCKPTVDLLAGSLLQMPMLPNYLPVGDGLSGLTLALNSSVVIEKELMNWGVPYFEVVRGGLIHEAVMRVTIDRRHNKIGNVGLECCHPGTVLSDPMWKSWLSSDCRLCWREAWMTPEDMMKMYPDRSGQVKVFAELQKQSGLQFGEWTGIIPYNVGTGEGGQGVWGNSYLVIEQYEMREVVVKKNYVMTLDGRVEIPQEVEEVDRIAWMNENVPDWQPEMVYEEPCIERVCYMTAICPGLLPDVLASGKTEVQMGSLPFKWWSASRANGEPYGIIDACKDPQQNINFWEALMAHKIKIEGGGGSQFADPSKFRTPQDYDDYVRNRNNPAKVFPTKPGALEGGGQLAVPTIKSAFPEEAYRQIEHIIQTIWPHVTTVTPTTLGRVESAGMPNKLYENLKIQSDLQSFCLHYGLRMFWNDFYEGYYNIFSDLYSRPGTDKTTPVTRKFVGDGGNRVVLNEQVEFPDGSIGLRNDVRELKKNRHRVIISERPDTPSQKAQNVELYGKILPLIRPEDVATRKVLSNEMIANIDEIPPDKRIVYKAIGDRELARDLATLDMQIAQAELATKQARDALAAAQQPAMPPAPTAGGMPESEMGPIQEQANEQPAPGAGETQQTQTPEEANI